ncbi:MAG: rRNA cytosine-C5-methyltransferase, partial [Nocardioides sp.]
HRAALVQRALGRSDGVMGVIVADGTQAPWREETFDRILVDAPCTGLGALRRRPESRWTRSEESLDELVPLQVALLDQALTTVRPGGVVLYATCSPVLAETMGVVQEVLRKRTDAHLEDVEPLLKEVCNRAGPLQGTVQLWPHRHGTDAMFLALLRRTPQ